MCTVKSVSYSVNLNYACAHPSAVITFFINLFTSKELKSQVKTKKTKRSTGFDQFSVGIFQTIIDYKYKI